MPGDDALSLLIVDDSTFFTSLLSDKLESSYDMRTTTAPTAADGMDALERESIDCVVSDYQMPGSSGLDLFEMVRERYDVPFILLTAEEFVGRIAETGTHIAELTSIARDFVESFEDGSGVDLEPVHVDRVLAAEVEKRQTSFEDARIELADPSSTTVLANELLSSVFGNLLTNAIRHNDAETPEVHVSVEETETTVCVRVADNGPGVPDDRKDAIFGKGQMGPESPGTGVGLYLVHTLVDRYGGDVWVEDNDPTGAVFVVELPNAPEGSATGE